ncbi:MAG: Asp-tRNA(Asn)/Glu-tRNA(Gln) amidotransferase GatCAB subunit B [Parcubacteria group bacterium]|jgi:aspartyl-tRNA(Asn)/glutamyl-tRNA(Gln) amidotransferase subunit B|nr:Asp-tRNA(Asn)/Glu-tRNA(Gln) amidotransferase GatCAB subunit B [Parcubacteria group bacterium]
MKYVPVIGLEIHSELKTASKMFCNCLNDPEAEKSNVNVCPICMGHPGTLPVINQTALELVIRTGLALNCQIPKSAKFDRKNYFYPDLPKGYQISQYDLPLSGKGSLEIDQKKIRITRIHLEEDTGRLVHSTGAGYSLVDFNRAGVPLMELVTEPDIDSGQQARQFCEELQIILRYLQASEANMEKGQMRCEVNISLGADKRELGVKVEIKNLNSFRAVERSIDYEIKRQTDLLESGGKVVQETRGWDEIKQKTFSQRKKEGSADYRYFPEPDLPPLTNLADYSAKLKVGLPELPQAKRDRFLEEYKLPEADVNTLVTSKGLADYFEQVVSELTTWLKIKKIDDKQPLIKLTANYFLTELQKLLIASRTKVGDCKISAENFAEFISMIEQKDISSSAAQTVLKEMFETGTDPSEIVDQKQLKQVSDQGALEEIVNQVIKNNPRPVEDYKAGKENALQFLVGKVMAVSKGQANPEVVREILKDKLVK